MNDEYLSVSEFAKRAGVSRQAVYSKIDKELSIYLTVDNGKKLLNIKGLSVFDTKKVSSSLDNIYTLNKVIDQQYEQLKIKDQQITDLTEQLKAKDKQISDYSERLKEINAMLNHEQQLHGGTIVKQLQEKDEKKKPKWPWKRR